MVIATNCPPLEATCTDCRTTYNLREAMASDRASSLTGWKDAFRSPQEVSDLIADAAAAGLPMWSAFGFCTLISWRPPRKRAPRMPLRPWKKSLASRLRSLHGDGPSKLQFFPKIFHDRSYLVA